MTVRGTVKNGVVVLDSSASLPEGARVNVQTMEEQAKSGFHPVPLWDGPEGEVEELLREVQEVRG